MIRVLIADDHRAIRESLRTVFRATDFQIAAEATDGVSAVELAAQEGVDIALLDIAMPDGDGLTALTRIKENCPSTAVVIYSIHDAPRFIRRTRELGADGYLVKGVSLKKLLQTLHEVHAGRDVWPPVGFHGAPSHS